jgi:hypothetical protein
MHEIHGSMQNMERSLKEIADRSAKEKESSERTMLASINRSVQEALAAFTKKQGESPYNSEKEKDDNEESSNSRGHHNRDHRRDGQYFRPMKMEFPKFRGDDPIIWLDRSAQFFEYQATAEEQKVTLAAFYLEGEANQWWQWVKRIYQAEDRPITWPSLRRNYWPGLVQPSMKIMTRLCLVSSRKAAYENIIRSLKSWPIVW